MSKRTKLDEIVEEENAMDPLLLNWMPTLICAALLALAGILAKHLPHRDSDKKKTGLAQ